MYRVVVINGDQLMLLIVVPGAFTRDDAREKWAWLVRDDELAYGC